MNSPWISSSSSDDSSFPPAPQLMRQVTKESSLSYSRSASTSFATVNVLMIGTGEYTTGFVNGKPSDSDKSAGVVALTMFDLRRRGLVKRLGLCGVNGTKFEAMRRHMQTAIGDVYFGLDVGVETFPGDDEVNELAYVDAIKSFLPGDIAVVYTPDDTHVRIALACIEHGMHVLVTKPVSKTLADHFILYEAAERNQVIVAIDVHKRWDPIYSDSRDRIKTLGPFSYLYSYMSQPKHQLEAFKAWAGKSSDISYYLNSHHVDFHEWSMGETARPVTVIATASNGVAHSKGMQCEDTITLTCQWENLDSSGECLGLGTAIYTASWIAAKSDVHSQQRFFYMGHQGEVTVDQAHRGYTLAADGQAFRSVNPLYMKYTPTDGFFSGQHCYGYRAFEVFVDAARSVNSGCASLSSFNNALATIQTTFRTTAILEAGRRSLDEKCIIQLLYEDAEHICRPTGFKAMH